MTLDDFLGNEFEQYDNNIAKTATSVLGQMIDNDLLTGDLLKLDYNEAVILVHDHLRQKVGGVPLGCFLLATRLSPGSTPVPTDEDAELLLLRVLGPALLPNSSEADSHRLSAGQRACDTSETWDSEGKTDQYTLNMLRYSGLKCRIVGTFFMKQNAQKEWKFTFGADIANFYTGQGMKVYKATGNSLAQIVNYMRDPGDNPHRLSGSTIDIGVVRYAATSRGSVELTPVPVQLDPTDLIARRTALFGMSRTGKSNTTKEIAGAVFGLRSQDSNYGRVGQLIFDLNGEYANENTQDSDGENPSCLKNISVHTPGANADDITTYGLSDHPNDPARTIVKINFFGSDPGTGSFNDWLNRDFVVEALEPLTVGKAQIDNLLAESGDKYIKNFKNTPIEPPLVYGRSEATRYRRAIMIYRTAIAAAGMMPPNGMATASIANLFGQPLRDAMANTQATGDDADSYRHAAQVFATPTPSWDQMHDACKALRKFIADTGSGYSDFNRDYQDNNGGKSWHDDTLTGLLAIFEYPNGIRALRDLREEHDPNTTGDYAERVVDDVRNGKLVIIDQSLGSPEMNKYAAERIMWSLFNRQKQDFVNPRQGANGEVLPPPDVLVYAEEAHNLLPSGTTSDTTSIWSRTAKEGSKYRIGLVYATQEPSSIQSNIMKNTDNWFVAHLNNTDEIRELRKYYDFEDFAEQTLRVPDPGFIRMRTLSNPYIVPIQVNRFSVQSPGADQ